jgi:hypothetical protein
MLDRGGNHLAAYHERKARNSKRYRRRFNAGQRVLRITAYLDRAQRAAVRRGYLAPGVQHGAEAIEVALTAMIDDAGKD